MYRFILVVLYFGDFAVKFVIGVVFNLVILCTCTLLSMHLNDLVVLILAIPLANC